MAINMDYQNGWMKMIPALVLSNDSIAILPLVVAAAADTSSLDNQATAEQLQCDHLLMLRSAS